MLLFIPFQLNADTSVATISVGGVVPTYFSVVTRGQPGDLDLTPNTVVSNRTIAVIHFKFNQNVSSMIISSSTATGFPEDSGGNSYPFGGVGGFKVAVKAGCQSVDATYNTPFTLTNAGVDVKSALASALVAQGIEEDCQIMASYTGTSINWQMA